MPSGNLILIPMRAMPALLDLFKVDVLERLGDPTAPILCLDLVEISRHSKGFLGTLYL